MHILALEIESCALSCFMESEEPGAASTILDTIV